MSKNDSQKVKWEEMFPDELLEAIRRCPVCYCAYGLAEPHGAYNALGLDWLKAYALVERAAKEHGGVVAPPFAWHIQERPEFDWFGYRGVKQPLAGSIPADLFYRTVLHQIRSLDARGFRAGILITGHYGGLEQDMRLLCEYYLRRTGSPLRLFAAADCEVIRYEDYRGDHAGACETSQLMALRPELVDLNRKEPSPASGPWAGKQFPQPDGKTPSRETGDGIVDSQIAELGRVAKELLDSYKPKSDYIPPTLNEADDIWSRFEKLTRKYWWCSLTLEEYHNGQLPAFPGWETLCE
ncbi:MAG: creatininase family protein [Armatimonadota bacterium]|nr:creatininase family protein [Armatimonadota bacterium]